MTTPARFEFRLPSSDKQRIDAAAALARETASDFARATVLSQVDEMLQWQEHTYVPADFFHSLLEELDKAPVADDALARAANQARDFLEYGDHAS
jgi:uncharacterized protein (DUF1778 family)